MLLRSEVNVTNHIEILDGKKIDIRFDWCMDVGRSDVGARCLPLSLSTL